VKIARSVSIDIELWERAVAFAAAQDRTFSWLVTDLLRQRLAEKPRKIEEKR